MYQNSYSEVLETAPQNVRDSERAAILHSIRLMERAEEAGHNSHEAVEALFFLRRLWEFFLVHLADEHNGLPEKLRADLISIGLSILREGERIRANEVRDFSALKDISKIIANGLS